MNGAGRVLVALAVVASLAGFTFPLAGRFFRRPRLTRVGLGAMYALVVFAAAAVLVLLAALLARDFGNFYVYQHSSRSLSGVYTVSALWSGNAGSLLLWLSLTAVFAVIAARGGLKRDTASAPYLMSVLSFIGLFFSLLVLFAPDCNPFVANPIQPVPSDGLGLNPTLQSVGMVIHPVALYLGYVAMAVPFGLVVAGLAAGTKPGVWIGAVRRWTLVGWFFLTVGNVVGAWWAYVTLGWGGYWAWDPVENASLIPWLTATALLHSAIVAHRRQRQQVWMVALAMLTFLLTIFGTFLTRTGVAVSVHAFAQAGLIPWFAVFMVLLLVLSVALLGRRFATLRGTREISGVLSDESDLLYTVVLLCVVTFFILWGVVYPPIAQAITGRQFVFGAGFFDSVTDPLGLLLLALLCVCAVSAAGKASKRWLTCGTAAAVAAGVVVLAALLGTGVRGFYPVAAFTLCGAAIVATAVMFARTWRGKRRYGALVVHLGLLILIVGLAGSWAFKQSTQGQLAVGDSLTLGKFQIVYEDLLPPIGNQDNMGIFRAALTLSVGSRNAGDLYPSLETAQGWSRVARRTSPAGDVYVSLLSVDTKSKIAAFRLEYHPLIVWLWIGGGVMGFGGLLALWSLRRRRPAEQAGAPHGLVDSAAVGPACGVADGAPERAPADAAHAQVTGG